MNRMLVALSALLLVMAAAAAVFGLGMNYPNDRPITAQPEWPAGVGDLANFKGRVNAYMVNSNDWAFFTGDAKALREFLDRYAEVKDIPHVLVLHPGRGLTGGLGDEPKTPFDWSLDIIRRGWGGEMPEAFKNSPSKYVVTVHVWLGGNIGLKGLDIPLSVEAQSSNELENFVVHHNNLRNAPPAKAAK
jgi:hypothetical protein